MTTSSSSCSASVSTSFIVETRCCDSTTRQHAPDSRRRSGQSAPGVQVPEDMNEAGDRLDEAKGRAAERDVVVSQPRVGHGFVAAGDRVEGAEQTDEED